MQRAVLINSPPHGEVPFRPLGLAYLRAVLERDGIDNVLVDLCGRDARAGNDPYAEIILYKSRSIGNVADGLDPLLLMQVLFPDRFDDLLDAARAIIARVDTHFDEVERSGDVFLFTANVITYYFAAAMAHRLRRGGKRTAVGGPSTWYGPFRELLLRCGAFDVVVSGEGEPIVTPLVVALRAGDVSGVPGAAWLDGSTVRVNDVALPPELETLPRPLFAVDEARDFVPILGSRGCSARCAFCSEPHNWRAARRRDPAAVAAEMDSASDHYGLSSFHFHDDMINVHLPWLDELLGHLVVRGGRYRWESFCGPNGLDRGRLGRMRDSGCELLKLGVQSFAPETLYAMRRGRDVEHLRSAIVTAEKLGISLRYDMLVCFPGETERAHRENVRLIEALFAETESVHFSLNPFYLSIGSETHLRAAAYGITLRHFDAETLPPGLADTVRACGEIPVGFAYDLQEDLVRRRVGEIGNILKAHGRDYLYLGQQQGAGRSGAFPVRPPATANAPAPSSLRDLLLPWRAGAARGAWRLDAALAVEGGEDGLVKYVFSRASSHADGPATVAIRLTPRNERPCYARTRHYSVFYDVRDGDDDGDGAQPEDLEALLTDVIERVRSNERDP